MRDPDLRWMNEAIREAALSKDEDCRPHPRVGVVVVKGGRRLGAGHRGQTGSGDHAEYGVLEKLLDAVPVAGATIYTTLEPCTTRKHPKVPCADRLIEHKVKRVVVGMLDPDQRITGRGIVRLQNAGIQVDLFPDRLFKKVAEQNGPFSRAMTQPTTSRTSMPTPQVAVPVTSALGLETVAARDDVTELLPPADFYESAKHELLLTGVSVARTFDIHISVLRSALARGKRVCVLILDPKSPDVRRLSKREGRPIGADIRSTLRIARLEGFLQHPGFELRLAPRLPPFTAVMLDGNISNDAVAVEGARLRVQPGTSCSSQHDGVVMQFRRGPPASSIGFDYFAGDLRGQWQAAKRLRGRAPNPRRCSGLAPLAAERGRYAA